jgi:SH3-like domain-containing protein
MRKLISILFVFILYAPNAYSLCIDVETANLRSKPNAQSNITWVVPKHMPLKKVDEQDGWLRVVDAEGDAHWVHKSIVTYQRKCAVVKVNKANLRTAPGSKSPQVSFLPSVERYATLIYVKREGNWAKLKDDAGNSYWVYRKLIWVY